VTWVKTEKQIGSKKRLEKYYKREDVISSYFKERFETPIGKVLHRNQVEFINEAIKKYKIKSLLEIAPGPARLTTEIKAKGYLLDANEEMLSIAKKRLKEKGLEQNWKLIKADAFDTKLKDNFSLLIVTFRFIRHFKENERKKLYSEIRRLLKPNGFLIFDVPNYYIETILRKGKSTKEYPIYDKLWKKNEFIYEMERNGFDVIQMKGNLKMYPLQAIISKICPRNLAEKIIYSLDKNRFGKVIDSPLEWLVLCRKK